MLSGNSQFANFKTFYKFVFAISSKHFTKCSVTQGILRTELLQFLERQPNDNLKVSQNDVQGRAFTRQSWDVNFGHNYITHFELYYLTVHHVPKCMSCHKAFLLDRILFKILLQMKCTINTSIEQITSTK